MADVVLAAIGTANSSNTDGQTQARTLTPADDSIIYVGAVGRDTSTPGAPTISDTSGKTWTLIGNSQTNTNRMSVWYAEFPGASPGSITITVDWGTVILTRSIGMMQATLAGTAVVANSVVVGTGSSTTPATAAAPALSAVGNGQVLFAGHRHTVDAASTAEGGWTKIFDTAASEACGIAGFVRVNSSDTSPTCTIGGSAAWMAKAWEVGILNVVEGGGRGTSRSARPRNARELLLSRRRLAA